MPVITIREQQKIDTAENAKFEAILSFNRGMEYPVTITDPFTSQDEKRLEWYFEEFVTFPFSDTAIAEKAAASVKTYGERLFEQVFKANLDVYSEYRQLRGALSQVQIEIIGKTPEFQALHWEALRDPDLPLPLVVECVAIRKYIRPVAVQANVRQFPVINLLVVAARPSEEHDVGYRTISRPLIEAIQNSNLRVNIDLLRPGTYEALENHLSGKGEGFYHIIHFDAHGGLATYDQIQKPRQEDRYRYRYGGRPELQRYEGVKAFLFLEGDEKGKADAVEATELADLLKRRGIPVCILNACQSAKQISGEGGASLQDDYRETSLGSQLMAAGMQMVVAMGYSITVSAAALLMERLYSQLFAEKGITEAIRLGRRELFMNKKRRVYYNQRIDLEDWLLPVVYCNQAVDLNLREFRTPQEKKDYLLSKSKLYRFPQPEFGFVGRDLEILKIEKALLRHNILLLQGMGGTGKTTLLNYLREWWQTTNFTEKVFYFGYDEKAWTLQQVLRKIGKQVYGEFDKDLPQDAQVEELVTTLRTNSYAIILDNLESVTGQKLAIKNTLSKPKRNEIRDFLARLAGGKTRVVLGSRSSEEWLQDQTFRTNVYQLQGLDREARTVLAEKILERHVAAHHIPTVRKDPEFARLMQVLAGYPLAMEVLLANLKRQSPAEILAALQAADVDLDIDSEDKTKSILKCVEYSHSNLSPEAQKLLLCLAPFSGFIVHSAIPNYVEQLQKLEPFKNYAFDKFDEAVQEAISWGLLSPDSSNPPLLAIQPVFPYFLKTKLETLDDATHAALREGFKNHYLDLAGYYKQFMDSKDPDERQLGQFFCQLEYENLYNALHMSLEKQENISIFFCLDKYFELTNDTQSKLNMAEMVCQGLEKYPPAWIEGELDYQVGIVVDRLAAGYLDTKQYQQAKQSYERVLEISQALKGTEERVKKGWFASTYHNLGIVAQQLREFEKARRNYQLALEINIEFGDRYNQASTYHNLGLLALAQEDFPEARANLQKALEIYVEFKDEYRAAIARQVLEALPE